MAIHFFHEDIDEFKLPRRKLGLWIKSCCDFYKKKAGEINFIFCSDEYLKQINIQYLKHDYYTDIITFDYNEGNLISGDIYISTDRVYDNSVQYKVDFKQELNRVIIHGILHLVGFNDHSKKEKDEMHQLEEFWLEKLIG